MCALPGEKNILTVSTELSCAIHAQRVTIMPKDIQLARRIRGELGQLSLASLRGRLIEYQLWLG